MEGGMGVDQGKAMVSASGRCVKECVDEGPLHEPEAAAAPLF